MKIILIEDDQDCLDSLSKALSLYEYDVYPFSAIKPALHFLKQNAVDVIISDFHLKESTGITIMETLQPGSYVPPVIIISGDPRPELAVDVLLAGAHAFFRKPLSISALVKTLHDLSLNV